MLAPRFMGCCPRIPRAEEGARGGKKRISNEKREREREVVLAKTKIECEKRQQEEEENVSLSAGARFQSRCLLFQRERDGFAISTLAPFFTRYRLRLYYISRDSLSTIIISTRIPRLS